MEGTEGCDDGNVESDDGCSSNCAIEFHYACFDTITKTKIPCVLGTLSVMIINATCGNGFLEGQERCDSINTLIGQTSEDLEKTGCANDCIFSLPGFYCNDMPNMP